MGKKKVIVLSDFFCTPLVMEKAVQDKPFWLQTERKYFNTEWPKIPFHYDGECKEYTPYPEEAIEEARDCEAIITHIGLVDRRLIETARNLKIIGCLRSGPVNVDVTFAASRKIPVVSTPFRGTEAVAEYVVGLMIALRRSIVAAHEAYKRGAWTQNFYYRYDNAYPPFSEQRIGFVGFGNIARACIRLLAPFHCECVAYDPFVSAEAMAESNVQKIDLEELLKTSDIVSLHLRYAIGMENMMDWKQFRLMKPTALFINTARGRLVNETALETALREKWIAGAALDTFWDESQVSTGFVDTPSNLILTPHIAGASRRTADTAAATVVEAIEKFFVEHSLQARINKPGRIFP
ncbi:MAG TPA: NAD(P)-dependent oxidoreductase [Atribacteraceae bacterium]|nr:NAD(P)-dependent oxidoreductase [Atribacteraceae bacterium]